MGTRLWLPGFWNDMDSYFAGCHGKLPLREIPGSAIQFLSLMAHSGTDPRD